MCVGFLCPISFEEKILLKTNKNKCTNKATAKNVTWLMMIIILSNTCMGLS